MHSSTVTCQTTAIKPGKFTKNLNTFITATHIIIYIKFTTITIIISITLHSGYWTTFLLFSSIKVMFVNPLAHFLEPSSFTFLSVTKDHLHSFNLFAQYWPLSFLLICPHLFYAKSRNVTCL